MKVSIIIPAFNEEKYIEKTIFAVKSQNYFDIEIIVVDNNSTDKTLETVNRIEGIRVIEEKRKGVQYARECGRLSATGEIIANLDADCLPPPDWVTKALKYFEDDKVVAVSGPYYYHDGNFLFRYAYLFILKTVYILMHNIGSRIFKRGAIVFGGNVFIRSNVLQKIGGYNTSVVFYGDDTDIANRLIKVGKVLFKNNMVISSSSRRFERLGLLETSWKYIINYFWVVIFKKPYHTSSLD